MKIPGIALVAAAILIQAACGSSAPDPEEASLDAGAGLKVDRQRYALPIAEVWDAAEAVVAGENDRVEQHRRFGGGGEIVARRPDGHRVKVRIRGLQGSGAEVVVCVEPGNLELAGMIQGRIGEKLSLKQAQAGLFGESSVQTSYEVDLEHGLAAAEKACRALGLEVTHKQVQESRARLDARDQSARPVRITMRLADGRTDETEVFLSTETTAGSGEKEFLRHVRQEIERHLFPVSD